MKVKISKVYEWIGTLSFNEMCDICKAKLGHRNFNMMTKKDWKDCFMITKPINKNESKI